MNLLYPWALIAPLIALALFLLNKSESPKIPFPSKSILAGLPTSLRTKLRTPVLGLLSILTVTLLSLAAARPQITQTEEAPAEAHDLMLVIDISGSMKEQDYRSGFTMMNRLDAVKLVVSDFITERGSDRIGLAAFGTQAFLQSPLTSDDQLVRELLELLEIGIAGEGTAIGDGLGVALKGLSEIEGASKAIILLTDGSNNSGKVSPLQAASIASKLGIKIHTIGMGAPSDQRRATFFSQPAEYDEKTLREIASLTGGVFFNAKDTEGLKSVYAEIDKLERRAKDEPQKIVLKEYFPELGVGAMLSLLAYLLLNSTVFMRIPE